MYSPNFGYIRSKEGFPLSFLSTPESGTLMLFRDYFSVNKRNCFHRLKENKTYRFQNLVFCLESVVEAKQGIGAAGLEGVILSVLSCLAFHKFCVP